MSSQDIKNITESLDTIKDRLTKLEQTSVQGGYGGGACAQPNLQPYGWQGMWRSLSSPSVFKDCKEDDPPEEPTETEKQKTSHTRAKLDGTLRFSQPGVPPPQPFFPVGIPCCCSITGQPLQQQSFTADRGPPPTQPDYKSHFEVTKNSVSKTVLDSDWSLTDSRAGIQSLDRETAAILGRNARHVETELKLMQELQASFDDQVRVAELLDNFYMVQKMHMRYIQEEYNSLQIGGLYGNQAKSMFKAIRRNTSVYTPAFIDDIKTVLNVTSCTQQQQRPQCAQNFNNNYRPRFQPRFGGNQQSFRPRHPNNQGFGLYPQRSVPPNRDDNE